MISKAHKDRVSKDTDALIGSCFSPLITLRVFSSICASTFSVGEFGAKRRRTLIVRASSLSSRLLSISCRRRDLYTAARTSIFPNWL